MTRFIPAGAGNTSCDTDRHWLHSVYPRWRGEHRSEPEYSGSVCGLSPLARGTHTGMRHGEICARFIPAGAGNTASISLIRNEITVYPRWRGEHPSLRRYLFSYCGLSPLARGTLQSERIYRYRYRFIPAGAGNTDLKNSVTFGNQVYPRWRGEHVKTV